MNKKGLVILFTLLAASLNMIST